nr:MAG TPA: hypothetical protein [Crassvirales sp.]
MSKLLTPKIHTSSSSTKTLTSFPPQPPHTPLSPAPTQQPLKTTKCIYYLFLNQNTPSLPQPECSYQSY